MSLEIAWKQNFLVIDSNLLKSQLVVFGLGSQAFISEFSRQNICSVGVVGGPHPPSATRVPTALCCLFPAAVARAKNERRRRTFAVFQGRHYLPYLYSEINVIYILFIALTEDKKPITKHIMSANIC